MRSPIVAAGLVLVGCATPDHGAHRTAPGDVELDLPDGGPGIGFDDLRYSPRLGILVPAARTGDVDVIDPRTRALRRLSGFSVLATYEGGHDDGVTSVDDTGAALVATDRTARTVVAFAADTGAVIATAKLAGGPDYVRHVASTGELWVTEPDAEQIEIFHLSGATLTSDPRDRIAVPGGPESLVIDPAHDRAYTHLWAGKTVAIDTGHRTIVATWPNRCKGSRGIALDAARGFLLVGCAEGSLVVLDVAHDGAVLGQASPPGLGKIDIIDYSPALHHAYLSGTAGTIAVVGVDANGAATALGELRGAPGSHCATTDGAGQVFACDPPHGRIVVRTDPYPATP